MENNTEYYDQIRETDNPDYHPSVVGPEEAWKGKTWRDMPGRSALTKRLEFMLFRRGLYNPNTGDQDL